jgi:hypothetical protein
MAGLERPWGSTGISWLIAALVFILAILATLVPVHIAHLDLVLVALLALALLL